MNTPNFTLVNIKRRPLLILALAIGIPLAIWAGKNADNLHQWIAVNGDMTPDFGPFVPQ